MNYKYVVKHGVCALLPPLGQGSRYSSQSRESNKFIISSFSCTNTSNDHEIKKIRHIYNCSSHVPVSELDGKKNCQMKQFGIFYYKKENALYNQWVFFQQSTIQQTAVLQYVSCQGPKFLKHFLIHSFWRPKRRKRSLLSEEG